MFVKRLFPSRWAKILAWLGAGLAWGSVAVAASVRSEAADAAPQEPAITPIDPATTTTTPSVSLPTQPTDGLVVIRYAPVAAPAPEVIVQTVSVPGKATASASTASALKVTSSGS